MADVISSRLIFDGGRKVIQSYTNVSDGTGDSTMIVDVGNLTPNNAGQACTNVILQKIWYNITTATFARPVQLQWNVGGGTNVNIFSLSGGDSWDLLGARAQPVWGGWSTDNWVDHTMQHDPVGAELSERKRTPTIDTLAAHTAPFAAYTAPSAVCLLRVLHGHRQRFHGPSILLRR